MIICLDKRNGAIWNKYQKHNRFSISHCHKVMMENAVVVRAHWKLDIGQTAYVIK